MVAPTPSSYSARVRLELIVDGQRFPLAQIGGGHMIFDRDIVLPGSSGEVIAYIDNHHSRWHVTWEPSLTPRRTIMAEFRELLHTPAKPA